jgi:hypothetical protein
MKPYERRAAGAYPFFKLAVWDVHMGTWRAGKRIHPTEQAARAEARPGGRYRVSRFTEGGAEELPAFEA